MNRGSWSGDGWDFYSGAWRMLSSRVSIAVKSDLMHGRGSYGKQRRGTFALTIRRTIEITMAILDLPAWSPDYLSMVNKV